MLDQGREEGRAHKAHSQLPYSADAKTGQAGIPEKTPPAKQDQRRVVCLSEQASLVTLLCRMNVNNISCVNAVPRQVKDCNWCLILKCHYCFCEVISEV